jgi:hypothetical protein
VAIRGGNYRSYLSAVKGLLPLMRSLEPFREMTADGPGWESRYLLGEAACRLSDIKKRANEDDDAPQDRQGLRGATSGFCPGRRGCLR